MKIDKRSRRGESMWKRRLEGRQAGKACNRKSPRQNLEMDYNKGIA